MGKGRVLAKRYTEDRVKYDAKRGGFVKLENPERYLYSQGVYPTKIVAADLPEWYVHGYFGGGHHGYISAKGVKHLIYKPNYFVDNHCFKYDTLYISYNDKIIPYKDTFGFDSYSGYDEVIGRNLIYDFVYAVEKHSDYDVSGIKAELEKKKKWYLSKNPR